VPSEQYKLSFFIKTSEEKEKQKHACSTMSDPQPNQLSQQEQKYVLEANSFYFLTPRESDNEEKKDELTSDLNNLEAHLSQKATHITSNVWPRSSIGKHLRKKAARAFMHGVEIRALKEPHILKGQNGLFAVEAFRQFDIVGEYCGRVTTSGGGEYSAYLDSARDQNSLGLDAQGVGNEARTINHYQSVADAANVIMKICYVEQLPRIMIVCKRNILIGEEFLLDYGDEYVNEYFVGKEKVVLKSVAAALEWNELAGVDES
jgi:hypothetical protein